MPRWPDGPLLLCWLASSTVGAAGSCKPGDAVASLDFSVPGKGIKVPEKVVCGEDAAAAVARIATQRKTGFSGGKQAEDLFKEVQATLDKSGYQPPSPKEVVDGSGADRDRVLSTAGAHSRRAAEAKLKKQYKLAVADFLRALARPSLKTQDKQKLTTMLSEALTSAEKHRLQSRSDGDLEELFEALEITDDTSSNDDVDAKKLKKKYRELSVTYHPDKNPESAQYFNLIRDAYEILSDPVKTLLYGTGGEDMVKKYEGGSDDLERTNNVERRVNVNLEDVYKGTTRSLSISRRVVCRSCRLHPHLPRCSKCKACPGKQEIRQRWIDAHRFYQEEVTVPSNEKCVQNQETFDVQVERGVANGDTISYPGKASQEPSKVPGDLLVQVSVAKHKIFRRIGNDLQATLKVSLNEALLGFERELVHLDGHIVKLGLERGVVLKPGAGLEIEGEGMPLREDPTSFGKLFVRFEIEFPSSIPKEAQEQLDAALSAVSSPENFPRVDYNSAKSSRMYKSEL